MVLCLLESTTVSFVEKSKAYFHFVHNFPGLCFQGSSAAIGSPMAAGYNFIITVICILVVGCVRLAKDAQHIICFEGFPAKNAHQVTFVNMLTIFAFNSAL